MSQNKFFYLFIFSKPQNIMLAKRRVMTLSKIHGLESKIDFSNLDDMEYTLSWERVLTNFNEFVTKAQNVKFKGLTMYNIDNVKSYNNDVNIIERVKREIHEGYTDFPSLCGIVPDDLMKEGLQELHDIGTDISTTAHIIDVDYEFIGGDMKILLYTRDINSSKTNLVQYDYNDYFYIELSTEVTMDIVTKAVNGYCWFLKNVRYPEAHKRFCKNRMSGVWKDKDRHEIPDSAPCDDPFYDSRKHESQINYSGELVYSIVEVKNLKSMYGYKPENQRFAKITTANPIVTCHLFQGLSKKYIGDIVDTLNGEPKYFPEMKFYEATTDIISKFLTETKLSGCVAIDIVGTVVKNNISTCDRAINAKSIVLNSTAPFYEPRVMFYDIECLALDVNVFPSADICPSIQISYLLMNGTKNEGEGVLCYKETPGYEWYETEAQMLIRFTQIILEFNPDAITGFNSNNFDMPYIMDRMMVLDIYKLAGVISRRKNYYVKYSKTKKSSKQFGTKEVVKYDIPGRIMMDQFEIIKGDPTKRLRSYALKAICAEYLGDDNKEDLAYKEIPTLFKSIEGRQRIASYCLQDTLLLHKIDQKMMLGITTWGMTKVLGVTPDVTLNRGLVYKLMSKLKQYTERYNFVIPSFTQKQKPVFEGKFQGAFVLDPDIGYYEDPVVVLDFASLYPALMIGWNLCYTTIVHDKKWMTNNPDKFETHCGVPFVKHSTFKGIIPMVEEEMARQRKAAKKKMGTSNEILKTNQKKLKLLKKFIVIKMDIVSEMDDKAFDEYINKYPDLDISTLTQERKDDIEKAMLMISEYTVQVAIYDSEQLANKIIMNSLYGMLGSPMATVPCVEIAKTITGLGRENLLAAKDYVENKYCEITGEDKKCKVIYGDSVLPDTPLLVKINDNIQIVDAEQIGHQYGIGPWNNMFNDSDKEYMEMPNNMYAWSDVGWTRLFRVMRHKCGKSMVTVRTHTGIVTCTVDHSLIDINGHEISPNDCIIGETRLLHSTPVPLTTTSEVVYNIKLGRKLVYNRTGQEFTSVKMASKTLSITTTEVYSMIHNKGSIMSWCDNYESVPLTREFAMTLGMFHGDGSCCFYKDIKKASWAINKSNISTIEKYMGILNKTFKAVHFKILDVRKSSKVYKLVARAVDNAKGVLVDFVEWFRSMSYYNNSEKSVHANVLSSSRDIQMGYLEGLYDSDGTKDHCDLEITQKGKRSTLGIATLLYMIGYKHVVIGDRSDKPGIYRLRARMDNIRLEPNTIKSITPVEHDGYVYDLTTENHHFHAGVGNMIVHNTDSIFINMPGISVTKAIYYGQQLDKHVQEDIFKFRAPMKMTYEKTFSPFIITRRKGYSGAKFEFNDRDFKVSTMGYQLVKRDSAKLCTTTMKTYFDYIFSVKDKNKAADSIRLMMHDLLGEHLTVDDFVITKKIGKAEYKTTPPHIKAWRRMVDRVGTAEAPSIGERFPYIVTKMNKKLGTDMGDATMDLQLANEIGFDNIQIDKEYYIQTFIFNPMVKIMDLIHGTEMTKMILNMKSYHRKETVTAKKGNLLGFFGKTKIVTKKKYKGLGFSDEFISDINKKRSRSAAEENWELMGDEDQDEKIMKLAELGND